MPYTLYDHLFAIALGIATIAIGGYQLWTLPSRIDSSFPAEFLHEGFVYLFLLLGGLAMALEGKIHGFSLSGG